MVSDVFIRFVLPFLLLSLLLLLMMYVKAADDCMVVFYGMIDVLHAFYSGFLNLGMILIQNTG